MCRRHHVIITDSENGRARRNNNRIGELLEVVGDVVSSTTINDPRLGNISLSHENRQNNLGAVQRVTFGVLRGTSELVNVLIDLLLKGTIRDKMILRKTLETVGLLVTTLRRTTLNWEDSSGVRRSLGLGFFVKFVLKLLDFSGGDGVMSVSTRIVFTPFGIKLVANFLL
jgi:hypothetical protein